MSAGAPLDGVRVLDFTRVLSGPHCTRVLADLGAEVVKLEPPEADLTRFSSPRRNSLSTYFVQQNTGKRCVSIDLATPDGVGLVHRMADRCDVVVENFRTGVMDRLGLGEAVLRATNPGLVYMSITGYGASGPWVHRRAYAPTVNAESGFTWSQAAAARREPRNDAHSHADEYTALQAAVAVLAALYQRSRTGQGQHIDVAMAHTMLYENEHAHDALYAGGVPPGEIRSFSPADYPVLTMADGSQVVVSGHPAERGTFEFYAAAMGRPDLATCDGFGTVAERIEHLDEMHAMLRDWGATFPDTDTFEAHAAVYRLPVGRLRTVADIASTEWAREREVTTDVSDRRGGTFRIPTPPWRFSDATTGIRGEPRYRGEDNREVMRTLLGLDDAEVDALEARGVLSSRVPEGL